MGGGERKQVLLGILLVPSPPAICSGELNPRANINTAPSSAPTPCDLAKVRGFVCLPPPNYSLGEKMRKKCRLITESFPPQLCWELGWPCGAANTLQNPCLDGREEATAPC